MGLYGSGPYGGGLYGVGGIGGPTFVVPTVSCRIAPGSLAADLNPAWTEIGSMLRSFTYMRGRQSELDVEQVGTCSLVFDNSTRTLDPAYTLGPFYPNLTANMQVSLQATWSGVTYDLFRGYVERFTSKWVGPNYGETTLECVDRRASLGQAMISGSFVEQLSGARILAVLQASGWTTFVSQNGWALGTGALGSTTTLGSTVPVNSIDTGRATVDAVTFAQPTNALNHIDSVVGSEPGRFFFDGAGKAVFQDRTHVTTPPVSAFTLTDVPAGADVPYRDVVPNFGIDQVFNDIQLTASDGTLVERADTASADIYWSRPLQRTTQLKSSNSDLWNLAGWLLYQRKQARLRIEQVTADVWASTHWPLVLASNPGDHVTVVRTPPGVTSQTMMQDSIIEQMTVTGIPGPKWQVVYQLSALPPTVTGWTLGTSKLDVDNQLVYR